MIKINNLAVKLKGFELKNINLQIEKGAFFCLLGPTGAGKSLILESLAGLLQVDMGQIIVNERDITSFKPEKRNISICYQDYCLFPHMTVKKNILYGLRFKNDRNNISYEETFDKLIDMLEIRHLLNRFPQNLSGGEKQRISLARALVCNPSVLLLDEPLSALDPKIKDIIIKEIKKIHELLKITIIMVTHNFQEAYYLADKVAIIDSGEIIQQGTIKEIFERPNSEQVAIFVGMKTIIELSKEQAIEYGYEDSCKIGIRPENIIISNSKKDGDFSYQGEIESIMDMGFYSEICINSFNNKYIAYLSLNDILKNNFKIGNEVYFGFNKNSITKL